MRIPDRWRGWVDGLVIVLLVLLAYGSALPNGYIWDDDDYVENNLTLRSGEGLVQIWTEPSSIPQYYPLVHTTFWIEHQLWGLAPFGYHLTNVLLHALGAVLLWRFLRRLELPGAWFCAALFAVHPVTVESVAWITERKNVLSTVFALAAAIQFWDYTDRKASKNLTLSAVFFVLALLSKTVVASLPAVLFLLLWWKKKPLEARIVVPLAAMLVVGGAMGWYTAFVERTRVGAEGVQWDFTLVDRTLIAGRALWFYASKLVLPIDLIFVYPRWRIDSSQALQYVYPVTALALPLVLLLLHKRIGRGPLVAVLIFGGVLFPALGFLNVYPHRYSFVADHFQHHAALSLIVLFGAGLAMIPGLRPTPAGTVEGPAGARQPRTALAGWSVILLVLVALTFTRNFVYESKRTLWVDTIARNPNASMAHNNLGIEYHHEGNISAAIRSFREAIRTEPTNARAIGNLANMYVKQGRFAEAEPLLRQAIGLQSNFVGAYANLGVVLASRGDYAGAIEAFEKANEVNIELGHDKVPHACAGLGEIFYRTGRYAEALENLDFALRNGMTQPQVYLNYAEVLIRLGQPEPAIANFQQALNAPPTAEDATLGLLWIRASHPDTRFRNAQQAARLAERLERSRSMEKPQVMDAVAAAYAANGDYDRAATLARDAVPKALEAQRPEMAERIEARYLRYRQQQPARTAGHPDY